MPRQRYEETYAALIRDGEVANTIVVDPADTDFMDAMRDEFDAVEVVGERDRPSPGWTFDGTDFIAPPQPEPDPDAPEPEEPPEPIEARMDRFEEKLDGLIERLGER